MRLRVHELEINRSPPHPRLRVHGVTITRTPVTPPRDLRVHTLWITRGFEPPVGAGARRVRWQGQWVQATRRVRWQGQWV